MKFIYFPFTYISASSHRALSAFFRKITVFQADLKHTPPAMAPLAASGFLERITPAPGYEARLRERIASFKRWGESMDDKERTACRAALAEPPFFTEHSSSRIRADIRKSLLSGKSPAKDKPAKQVTEEDRILWAYMILELAMEWDMKTDEIATDFTHYREMEKRLFDSVRDTLSEDPSDLAPLSDGDLSEPAGKEKIEERMLAWSILLPFYQEESGVFITDKKEVVDHLQEFSGLGETVFRLGPVPCGPERMEEKASFHAALETRLIQLARGEADSVEEISLSSKSSAHREKKRASLDLYMARGLSPSLFFRKAGLCTEASVGGAPSSSMESINTVVCLIGEHE